MKPEQIKTDYLKAVKNYIDCFCFEHEVDLEYVDTSDLDGWLNISDMVIGFQTIKYCVDNSVYWNVLADWYWFTVENEKHVGLRIDAYRKLRSDYEYKLGFKKFEVKDFDKWLLKTLNNGK